MNRKLLPITGILWLVLLISGCAAFGMPTPETVNERLAVMEITYQEVLTTATLHRKEGRLSDAQIVKFDKAFDNYEQSRNAARAAMDIADLVKGDGQADKMAVALVTIRNLIAEIE